MKSKRTVIGIIIGIIAAMLWSCCFYKLIKQHGRELESEYAWVYLLVYLAVLFFQKKIKISDNTTRDLTKGCDCMKKKSISVICAVLVISGVATVLVLTGNRGNVSNVNRVVGYSALYGENSINEAFDVIEKKFAKDFKGCTLAELRYDEDVENRFAEEIEKYHKENNQELIVVLSIFDTDEKGGDGGFNPNDTYANWQWYLVKTADKKSWEIINWGY